MDNPAYDTPRAVANKRAVAGFWEDPPDYFDKIVWPNYVSQPVS